MFKRIPGTKDILPDEIIRWQEIERVSRKIFSLYNYKEIRTPFIEEAALYDRSLGETTEIVQKQMFLIKKEKDTYALRPEGTASIVRAYIENNLEKLHGFEKFYYIGAMFRMERPQKGRLRQFHHIGCETIGSKDPDADVEIICLADHLLKALGIKGYKITVNSLGCVKDKQELSSFLKDKLGKKLDSLCDDCKRRFDRNILRILDCKNEQCKKIVKDLNIRNDHLCPECRGTFDKIQERLNTIGIGYEVFPYLVRGLDYYTGTVFEIKHPDLGPQQDALGAGGRYDSLVKELGGPDTGATGFALGVERLLLASFAREEKPQPELIFVISLDEESRSNGINLLNRLRQAGIASDTSYCKRSLKAAMRRANDSNARGVIIIGEDELKKNVVTFKEMTSGKQNEFTEDELIKHLKT